MAGATRNSGPFERAAMQHIRSKFLPVMAGIVTNVGGLARDVIASPTTAGLVKNVGGLAKDAITSLVTVDAARSMGG